jgi:anti-sigma factor RsiW
MEKSMTYCTEMDLKLADLLLDPKALPAEVQTHIAQCARCKAELAELKATMDLMDTWEAPEPSPYFMTRLNARMREEREAAPTGWLSSRLARWRAGLAMGSATHARPLAAMAMTIVLFLGGGAYLGITDWTQTTQALAQAAVVHDLQLLDNNAQLLDQLESISDNNGGD